MRPRPHRIAGAVLLVTCVLAASCAEDDPVALPADDSASWSTLDVSSTIDIAPWSDTAFPATSMAFLPDGRALVTLKGGFSGPGVGLVKLIDTDGSFVWDVGRVAVCTDAERGLLGIAVDPDYDTNRFIYLYYTRQMNDCALNEPDTAPVWNRVSRFVLADDGVDPATETILVDRIPGHQSSHNAGDLEFTHDGMLLVATGEAALPGPDDPGALNGKILRLDLRADDLVATDNPFADRDPPAALVLATGFRNPFRIAVGPDGEIIAADVGRDSFEEINLVEAGADYGWPHTEGPEVPDGSTAPIGWYRHDEACANAIIGGDFIDGSFVPRATTESLYVFADFGCGTVMAAEFDDGDIGRVFELGAVEQSLADVVAGPDGAIYLVGVGPGDFPIMRVSPR